MELPVTVIKQEKNNIIELHLFIQPKSSQDKIIGLHGNAIKIAITAPPIDGKANTHLIGFLAKQFKTPKKNIIFIRGELGRHKHVRILNAKHIPDEIIPLLTTK